jgi:hypothetical protein
MTINVNYIKDAGIIAKERIVLRALTDDDLGLYFLFKSTDMGNGSVENSVSHPIWLPDKPVKARDLIVIYSRQGNPSQVKNKSGSETYFFYLGSTETIWNESRDCVVLLQCKTWQVKSVADSEEIDDIS